MAIHLVLAFAAMTLTAADGAERMQPAAEELTDAQAMAVGAGRLLGAAGLCNGIAASRVGDAAAKVNHLIEEIVADDDELTSAQAMFADGIVEGKQSLNDGKTDCQTVDNGLKRLERALRE